MVSVTMTTVAKEAGPRRPSTSRNEGWREAHPSSGCSFLEFSCRAVKYGPPLGSEHLGAIFGKKSPGLKPNAWDVVFRAPSRGGCGRRAAVGFVVCFGWGEFFLDYFSRFFFYLERTRPAASMRPLLASFTSLLVPGE